MDRVTRARILLSKAVRHDRYKAPTPGTNPLGITFGALARRENNPKYMKKVITNRLGERQTVYINKEKLALAARYKPTKTTQQAATGFAMTGDVPSKRSILSVVTEEIKEAIRHPVATWQAGVAREYAAIVAINEEHGVDIDKMDLVSGAVSNMVTDIALSVHKEMTVNTGGLVGSIVGGAVGGGVGALAGDLLGSTATRKVMNDVQATKQAWSKLIDTGELEGKNPFQQVKIISQAAAAQVKENTADTRRGDLIGDVFGWAGGNSGGSAIKAIVPGAPPGIGAIPGIMTANYANAFDEEKKKGQSTAVAAWKALSRGVEKGFEREAKMRETVKQMWSDAMEKTIAGASLMVYTQK